MSQAYVVQNSESPETSRNHQQRMNPRIGTHLGGEKKGGWDESPSVIEGSLEVKLPTIWTVEKQR
jgi:hypothetical protein